MKVKYLDIFMKVKFFNFYDSKIFRIFLWKYNIWIFFETTFLLIINVIYLIYSRQ